MPADLDTSGNNYKNEMAISDWEGMIPIESTEGTL